MQNSTNATARRRNRRLRGVAIVVFAAPALVLSACAGGDGSTGGDGNVTPAAEAMEITVATAAAVDHTSVFGGIELGYFQENNLKVNAVVLATGVEIANQVAQGDAQFGIMGAYAGLTTIAKGVPITIVGISHGDASQPFYNANQGIVASAESGAVEDDLSSLRGKTIGLPVGASPEAYLNSLLEQEGMTPTDVEIVNMAPADAQSALAQGSVDAIGLFEPGVSRALAEVDGSILVAQGGAESWYDPGIIIANQEFVEANPEATEDFLTTIAQVQQVGREDQSTLVEVAGHWIDGLDPAITERAFENINFDMRLSQGVLSGFQDSTIPFLQAQGSVPEDFDVTSAMAPEYLANVVSESPEFFSDLPEVPESEILRN